MLEGWRKRQSWRKDLKRLFLTVTRTLASSGKGKEERVEKAVNAYLEMARNLAQKLKLL